MSRMAGYKVIDLKGKTITLGSETGVVIKGIYDRIEETRKSVILSGLVTTDTEQTPTIIEYPDFFVNFVPSSGDFVATKAVGTATVGSVTTAIFLIITVTDDDEIFVRYDMTTDTQPEANA